MDKLMPNTRILGLLTGVLVFFSIATLSARAQEDDPEITTTARAVTKSRTQDSFYFDPAPINQDVIEGEETRLRCDVSNRKHISFYWSMNDRKVANSSRRFQEDSDLRILRVSRKDDGGSYRCIATNVTTGVSLRSIEARLDILWIAKEAEVILRHPKVEAHIKEHDSILLKCHAEGNPEPDIEWYKNGIRLFSSDKIKDHKARLRIINITAEDNGIYSCRVRNTAGQVDSTDNFLLNVEGMDAAHLDASSFTKMQLKKRHSTVNFNCLFTNAVITEWYFQEKRLVNTTDDKIRVFPNGTLQIRQAKAKDAGMYKCVGLNENEHSPAQSFVSKLVLAYLDDITQESFDPKPSASMPKVVPVGGKFEIRCFMPDGLPPPTLLWFDRLNVQVPGSGRIRQQDGRLYISGATPQDTGNYTCAAENMAGVKKHDIAIVISVAPTITRGPLSSRVEEGEEASFDCKVDGTPYPVTSITWTKNEKPIDQTHPRFLTDSRHGTLRITDVHLMDEGNYACVVNTTGHAVITSTNGHLYVKKKLKFRPPPVNTKLELGSNSKIYCKAEGQDIPLVKWFKSGADEFPAHVEDKDGVLFFSGVLNSDVGMYSCVATSSQGTINATIHVDVVVKPKFKVKPANTTAYEGYPVMLHCVAIGDPTPSIQWDKNSKVSAFDFNRFKILPNGSLHVSEVYMEDMGKYGCTAGNSGGFEREEIYLHVASPEARDRISRTYGEESYGMMKTIIIAVCSAVAYLAVVIGLTVYCSIRLVRAKNLRKTIETNTNHVNHGDKAENGMVPTENTELMDKKERDSSILKSDDARSHASGVSSHHSHSSQSHQSSRRRSYDKLNFPRHDLQTLGMLGKGHYGDVFLARAHGIKDGEGETLVVVKSLLSRDEHHHFEFRREIDMFSKLNHEHVVRLLGVCRDMEPQFLITEYCEWGDLKQFLWATRKDNIKRNTKLPPLTAAQKTTMCLQVALGMEHLSNHRFVHRDLATRNVLLSPTLDLKISNLGLCRDIYMAEYYPFHAQLLPLRWMAPETVLDDEYSTKSDVWAFGVFCWEVFTLGDLPYKTRTDEEVLKGLKSGDCMLESMVNCPEDMRVLIEKCTSEHLKDRPSFSEVAVLIGEMTVDSDV